MNKNRVLLVVAVIAVIGLIIGVPSITGAAVVVGSGSQVTVEYTGSYTNGTVFDSSVGREPLSFTVGQGMMIPGFEAEIIGMRVGEEKTFTLTPSQAYGERLDELIVEFNKSELTNMVGSDLEPGMVLYGANGMTAIVVSVGEVNATLDLNHPLAGMSLIFEVKVLSIS